MTPAPALGFIIITTVKIARQRNNSSAGSRHGWKTCYGITLRVSDLAAKRSVVRSALPSSTTGGGWLGGQAIGVRERTPRAQRSRRTLHIWQYCESSIPTPAPGQLSIFRLVDDLRHLDGVDDNTSANRYAGSRILYAHRDGSGRQCPASRPVFASVIHSRDAWQPLNKSRSAGKLLTIICSKPSLIKQHTMSIRN